MMTGSSKSRRFGGVNASMAFMEAAPKADRPAVDRFVTITLGYTGTQTLLYSRLILTL